MDVTQRGITLRFLLQLVESGAVDATLTIQQVVDCFVRPTTAGSMCCLFDMVPPPSTGLPQFFVSHTWSRRLGDLLHMLKSHFKVEAPNDIGAGVLLWLDVVAINQHPYKDRGALLNDDVANLAKVVRATEKTLFCLDECCTSLSRIWCLYEVWQTFVAKGSEGLLMLMPAVAAGRLEHVFYEFNVMEAQATQPEDRVRILDEIARSIGAVSMNLQLKAALVDSARYMAIHFVGTCAEQAEAFTKAARLLAVNGKDSDALPLYRKALEMYEQALGPDHEDTLTCLNNFAACLRYERQYEEALPLCRSAMERCMAVMGAENQMTMDATVNLANCLLQMDRLAEAMPLYHMFMGQCEAVHGAEHPYTLRATQNLGVVLDAMGRYEEALPYFRKTMEGNLHDLTDAGVAHTDVPLTLYFMSGCLVNMGLYDEALPLCQEGMKGREETLGMQHRETVNSVMRLAECLMLMGRHDEALPLSQRALEVAEGTTGALHTDTLRAAGRLGQCLNGMGRYAEALPLCRRAVEGRETALGPKHSETLMSVAELAKCLHLQGQHDEAFLLCQRALEGYELTLGPMHPRALSCASLLANCLDSLGRHEEALPMFHKSMGGAEATLGTRHPETLRLVMDLGSSLLKHGDVLGARPLLQRAYESALEVLGPGHPTTAHSKQYLDRCCD